jgi:hypothetical protein
MLHGRQGFKPKVWGGIGVELSQTQQPTATLLTLHNGLKTSKLRFGRKKAESWVETLPALYPRGLGIRFGTAMITRVNLLYPNSI